MEAAESVIKRPAALLPCGAAAVISSPADGKTMDIGLRGVGLTGFAGLPKLAASGGGGFTIGSENPGARYLRSTSGWLAAILIAGLGTWMLLWGSANNTAQSKPVRLATAAVTAPGQTSGTVGTATRQQESTSDPASSEPIVPNEQAPVDGLKISSQSWRRGGLGSKALITLTLRNTNEYAVRDVEVRCSFARRDGSHLTDRTHTIHDVVNTKSRKTFARMLVGFVNINADRAKCSLVAAHHV